MKRILCPCDFSLPALQGIEYAAEVCQKINGAITLCHVQPSIWPEAVFLEPVVEESIESTSEKLHLIADGISDRFGIKTDVLSPRTTDTVEKTISNLSETFDLIIMGTNGVDDTFQFLFGSTAFNVAKASDCPVIIIPESGGDPTPEGIVYLHQENVNPGLDILIPLWWAQLLNLRFGIWVMPSGNDWADRRLVKSIEGELKTEGTEELIEFVDVFSEMGSRTKNNKWIHALAINHQKITAKNSGKRFLKQFTSTSDAPVLIFEVDS